MKYSRRFALHPENIYPNVPQDLRAQFERLQKFVRGPRVFPNGSMLTNFFADWPGCRYKGQQIRDEMVRFGLLSEVGGDSKPPHLSCLDRQIKRVQIAIRQKTQSATVGLRTSHAGGHFGNTYGSLFCGQCDRDTAHKGYTCILCGHCSPPPIARTPRRFTKRRARYAFGLVQAATDRKNALHRHAEESRRKFEGAQS